MTVTQYIGSRYVPIFADPEEWSDQNTYEPLTIVLHEGNSFTSKQAVPKGIALTNESYWAETGNYNAQVEQYRQEVGTYSDRISSIEDALPVSSFQESTVEDAISNLEQSTQEQIAEIRNTVNSFVSTNTSEVLCTVEYVNKFPINDNIYYAQGCTCDLYGNYYIVADVIGQSGNALLYKFDSNLSQIGNPLPINTHANALEYDSVNNRLVYYISNTRLGIVDCESMELVKTTTNSNSPKFNYSGIGLSRDYAVMNITGTYDYILFQRYGNTLNAFGSLSTPTAGAINFRQDACMENDIFYQLYSNGNVATRIRCISVGGTHACDFIITNVRTEFEGIFYRENGFYVVDAGFNMYKINNPLTYTGVVSKLFVNPAVNLFRRKSINVNDDTSKFVQVNVGSSTYQIGVLQFLDRINAAAISSLPLNINALGNGRVNCSISTTGAFTYRGTTRTGKIIEISYYTSNDYKSSVRLANIRYNVNGQEYNLYPTEAQLLDLDNLAATIQTFLQEAANRGLELGHIGIYGYGFINTNTTTLTSYDLNV